MKVWKRNAVVLTVVLFVCVALYLSWTYNREDKVDPLDAYISAEDNGIGASVSPDAGEDPLKDVNISIGGGDEEPAGSQVSPGAETGADGAGAESTDSYFAEARLTRQRARDSALEILNQAAAMKDSDQKARDKAAVEIENLAKQAMSEARIEGLVKAKGFAECVAYISEDGVNIVVSTPEGGLLPTDVAKIKDIVVGETKEKKVNIVEKG